ncbi:DUF1566 domain-containing protein [candidate division KSB1 bacterium]|nr:DUF1566 domain-containing protein [candidate division KSB1 bacterium]
MAEQKKCFVIMPFGEEGTKDHEWNWKIYFQIIKPVVEVCGYEAKRADELEYLGNITHDIIKWLYESQLVIADLTGKNPNVFYELGVRHALMRAGTIPIMRKGEKPPFDIANYRTIFYSIELDGPAKLQEKLKARIKGFENLQEDRCDNPVHETIGDKLPQVDVFRAQQVKIVNLQHEIENFKSIQVQKQELARTLNDLKNEKIYLEKQIADYKRQISKSTQNDALAQQKITELEAQLQQLKQAKPSPAKPPQIIKPRFRREPKTLSDDDAKEMIKEKDFYDSRKNEKGPGFENQYEELNLKGEEIVFDKASDLMWQQGGSEKYMPFKDAEAYIQKLKKDKFGGFDDWRLPTLEEAMSLMEPNTNQAGLYIDERFDAKQTWIWTADEYTGGSSRWCVHFFSGYCNWVRIGDGDFVRGVRFRQSSEGDLNI